MLNYIFEIQKNDGDVNFQTFSNGSLRVDRLSFYRGYVSNYLLVRSYYDHQAGACSRHL